MTRSATTYTVAFVATMALTVAAWCISILVLNGDEARGLSKADLTAVVLLAAFALPGAHVVAMFVSRPSWRRRSLYVTRLTKEAILGLIVVFPAWILGMALIAFALQALAGGDSTRDVGGEILDVEVTELAPPSHQAVADADEASADEASGDETTAGETTADQIVPDDDAPGDETAGGELVVDEPAPDDASELDEAGGLAPYAYLVDSCAGIGLLFAVVLVLRSFGLDMWRHLGFRTGPFWRNVGVGLVAYAVFQWVILPMVGVTFETLFHVFDWPVEGHGAFEEYERTHSIVGRAGILFAISVKAPLIEEVVFRGVLFQTLKRFGGSAVAILASAVVFAVLHAPLFVVLNIFFLGLLFAYLFDRTGSIVPGIVLHFVFNAQRAIALLFDI